jgi:hypothetical protein
VVLVQLLEDLPQLLLTDGRHVFHVAALELIPTDLSVAVEVDALKLGLQFAHQFVLHEVVGDEDHDGRLELVHVAEVADGLELTSHEELTGG